MSGPGVGAAEAAARAEQIVIDDLYTRLDELRARAASDLERVRRTRSGGTHQSRSERDAYATMYEDRLAQLRAVEDRLCFGRLDQRGGEHYYIGRIGLADDAQHRLLVDWRAEAAMPFYQATAANPLDVVRRRHVLTRNRQVTSVEDEVLDLQALSSELSGDLAGEGALMAAVNAQRTGRMGDIVATIQAEQDAIIRSELSGVLVVEGGPGTGKTAVALHRAAYLLYSHRERLARSGVLVIGPSPVFLRYIEQVLPSLGETGVVMLTPGRLLPGVEATSHDEPAVAALKGDVRMAQAIQRAVRDRQRVPAEPRRIVVDGRELFLSPAMARSARDKARRTGRPHNDARNTFAKDLLAQLADQLANRIGGLDRADRDDLIADLRESRDVRREINLLWMPLTPHRVVSRLLSDPDRLRQAAPWLDEAQIRLLLRPVDAEMTIDDVPLLDEAAELLGHDEAAASREAAEATRQRDAQTRYAREVLQMTGGGGGLVTAEQLAAGFAEQGPEYTLAERAAADRSWTYGHVVVDEAQELSPMMWRAIGRRNPTRSMTVVGDIAQTHSAAGARSWAQVLNPLVQDRWRRESLTVSYRTPGRIMRIAAQVVAGERVQVPTSVREGDWPVQDVPVPTPDALADGVLAAVMAQRAGAGGRVAVIARAERVQELASALRAGLGHETVGLGWAALDREVGVLDVEESKGLEFDGVVVVEPAEIIDSGPRGRNDLYVAMTRPTQQLSLVHAEPLPVRLEEHNGR
ncbi:MAG: HelD family protein [Actinomycetales bacterium]